MQADATKMGQTYMLLVKAGMSDLAEDIIAYDGEDSDLLDRYVVEYCYASEDYICEAAEALGELVDVEVETVIVIGDSYGDTRCYEGVAQAKQDVLGRIWLDEQLHDETFM